MAPEGRSHPQTSCWLSRLERVFWLSGSLQEALKPWVVNSTKSLRRLLSEVAQYSRQSMVRRSMGYITCTEEARAICLTPRTCQERGPPKLPTKTLPCLLLSRHLKHSPVGQACCTLNTAALLVSYLWLMLTQLSNKEKVWLLDTALSRGSVWACDALHERPVQCHAEWHRQPGYISAKA